MSNLTGCKHSYLILGNVFWGKFFRFKRRFNYSFSKNSKLSVSQFNWHHTYELILFNNSHFIFSFTLPFSVCLQNLFKFRTTVAIYGWLFELKVSLSIPVLNNGTSPGFFSLLIIFNMCRMFHGHLFVVASSFFGRDSFARVTSCFH